MMMPANFSAVNAEVVYGGAVADYLPNAWTAANIKKFNTNVITLISNKFFTDTVKSTLGVMFSGNWGGDDGEKIFGEDHALDKTFFEGKHADMTFGNKVMQVLGMASVVYTLGTTSAKVNFNDKVMGLYPTV